MVVPGDDPIRLKSKKYFKEKSRRQDVDSSSYSSSSASSISSPDSLPRKHVYSKKNKSVQCNIVGKESDSISTVQALLKRLRRKLKGDSCMSIVLDELEEEIDRLLVKQTNRNGFKSKGDQQHEIYPMLRHNNRLSLPSSSTVGYNVEINDARVKLDATCRELEKTCQKLKQERDTSIKLAADKSAELVETLVREAEIKRKLEDTNYKIKDMSRKLENYAGFMKNLSEKVKRLQYENREAKRLKQQVSNLSNLLRTMTEENKILLSDLHQVSMERNKLQLALTIQEQKLSKQNIELQKMSALERDQHMQMNEPWAELQSNAQLAADRGHTMKQSSDVPSSSPSPGLAPSLCRNDSANSARTPSPSSDHLILLEASADDEEEVDTSSWIKFPVQQPADYSSIEQQLNRDKIEELKEEIRNIFAEVRHLACDIPSMSVIDFNFDENSNSINWSEVSHNISVTD
ncbi:uncharacterized protein isoform X2 [Rhodnius prolixus]